MKLKIKGLIFRIYRSNGIWFSYIKKQTGGFYRGRGGNFYFVVGLFSPSSLRKLLANV